MKNHYILTQPAIDDIDSMLQYLTPLNLHAASKLAKLFDDAFHLLLKNPLLGVISEEDDDVLIWHIPNTHYSLPYTLQKDTVVILRVFHQSQQRPNDWQ